MFKTRLKALSRVTNRGSAFGLIARSITKELRTQSYVAIGNPSWLKHIFDSEIILPSTKLL